MSLDSFFNPIAHTTTWSSQGQSLGWDQQDQFGHVTHYDAQGHITGNTTHDSMGNTWQHDQSGHLVASAHHGPMDQTALLDGHGLPAGRIDHAHDHLFLSDGGLPIHSQDLGGNHTQYQGLADPLVHLNTVRFAHFAA